VANGELGQIAPEKAAMIARAVQEVCLFSAEDNGMGIEPSMPRRFSESSNGLNPLGKGATFYFTLPRKD